VGEVPHLLEPRPDDSSACGADPAHHLELLVDHHEQFGAFLRVAEEVENTGARRALDGVAIGAADGVHHSRRAVETHVTLRRRTDERDRWRVDEERPVGAGFTEEQPAEDLETGPETSLEVRAEISAENEVRTGSGADLLAQHPRDSRRVLVVLGKEPATRQLQVGRRQHRQYVVDAHSRALPNL
jgi:hypothetical protein